MLNKPHEVIVESIAATTTHTGLTVHAALDTGEYHTGTQIPDALMAALPIARHTFHSEWNYTLDPINAPPPTPDNLTNPAYTGMTTNELTTLTNTLQPAWNRHHLRGGRPHKLLFPQRLLATILHKRLHIPADILGHLFHTGAETIQRAITEALPILENHGTEITPAPQAHL
ncbi:hypothetical protein ACIA8K_37460 [Catenuloplanes sp. NPDC051500]|uniref:ISAzo13-like element transposase-related protein n=1 Tax=Catenuloplanes sp. NPDC051500 TaxID=3363959 RepID=UPI00378C7F81